jgi:hypothetical protein
MNRLWLRTLPPQRTLVVRQEDQLVDQMQTLQAAERKLGFARLSQQLQPIAEKVDVYLKTHGPMPADYYLDRQYMIEYSPVLLEKINGWIDRWLMQELGYEFERFVLELRQINGLKLMVRPHTADVAQARQLTFDPYHLRSLREAGQQIRTCLDIGAGTGAGCACVKALWPQCRIVAYEACPDRVRVLRINSRGLGNVQGMCAAVTDGSAARVVLKDFCRDNSCSHFDKACTINAMSLDKAAAGFDQIDLLRIGPSCALPLLLPQLLTGDMKERVRHVCGKLMLGSNEQFLAKLGTNYRIQIWPLAADVYFLAGPLSR